MTGGRDNCLACGRPRATCHCAAVARVDNRTPILLLQHRRERDHPFNTARILEQALTQLTTIIGYVPDFARQALPLQPGAGLLYPSDRALPLTAETALSQLVIVDGTWHHAKTMLRDVPSLRALPHYRLTPPVPGRYRIRREPTADALSTLESTVLALRILEPDTPGVDQLLKAFELMVDRQLAHPRHQRQWRRKRDLAIAFRDYHPALIRGRRCSSWSHMERPHPDTDPRSPCTWAAIRLGSGASVHRGVAAHAPALRASRSCRTSSYPAPRSPRAVSRRPSFGKPGADFLRPDDTLVVYHPATAKLATGAGRTGGVPTD